MTRAGRNLVVCRSVGDEAEGVEPQEFGAVGHRRQGVPVGARESRGLTSDRGRVQGEGMNDRRSREPLEWILDVFAVVLLVIAATVFLLVR